MNLRSDKFIIYKLIIHQMLNFDRIRNTKIKESLNLDQHVLNRTATNMLKYFGYIKRMETTTCPKWQRKAMSKDTDPEVAHQQMARLHLPGLQKKINNQPDKCIKTGHRQKHMAIRHHTKAIMRSPACVVGITQVSQIYY